ncbi:MAG: HindVP family restriction endonuclease [Bacteroidales bacterium]|nr:HindVP family restriction endonuclease [Bacteroidales bacterium]
MPTIPSLYGLKKTNRDYTKKETWGKNQFNSSFPASLCCYLESKDTEANYLSIQNKHFSATSTIKINEVFGISSKDDDIYFAFEAQHTPFQKYVIGTLPRTDLVIQKESNGECLSGLEVKLTALPDNTTHALAEACYGSEIVVRPDTIVYLACSIASNLNENLKKYIPDIELDWTDASAVLLKITTIIESINKISIVLEEKQSPFLLQPVWKTQGKSPALADNCLDMFVWSDAGFCNFISEISNNDPKATKITRQTRTAIWLFKMLLDIKTLGKFDHEAIIDNLSYNTKNDKAFASSGNITNSYMSCARLTTPIVTKAEIKKIILGGGQNLLSPERRFDAIIFNSPELFV